MRPSWEIKTPEIKKVPFQDLTQCTIGRACEKRRKTSLRNRNPAEFFVRRTTANGWQESANAGSVIGKMPLDTFQGSYAMADTTFASENIAVV
jgi:hypothetical protein